MSRAAQNTAPPDWVVDSVPVWTEDDATTRDPDHESIGAAWKRVVGGNLPRFVGADSTHDGGDATFYRFGCWVAVSSYPGANEIRTVSPALEKRRKAHLACLGVLSEVRDALPAGALRDAVIDVAGETSSGALVPRVLLDEAQELVRSKVALLTKIMKACDVCRGGKHDCERDHVSGHASGREPRREVYEKLPAPIADVKTVLRCLCGLESASQTDWLAHRATMVERAQLDFGGCGIVPALVAHDSHVLRAAQP